MSKVNADKYITIQGWMVSELNLKGNELLVYAIIYGFSQDDESWFTGSRQYLADWCNCSVRSIQTVLNNLVDMNLLIKSEQIHNGVKYCSYATNFTGGENFSRGGENISLNNIVNNTVSNSVSKDTELDISRESGFDFGKKSKPKTNLYSKCISMIDERFSDNAKIHSLLVQFLNMRLEMRDKPMYANQWKGLLNKLEELHSKGYDYEKVIRYSIEHGYASFYEISDVRKPSNPDTNKAKQKHYSTQEELESSLARNSDGTLKTF